MPPPEPPSVKRGRMIAGKPIARRLAGLVDGAATPRAALEADLVHRGLEQLAVLGLADRVDVGADQLDAVLLEDAASASASAGSARSARPGSAAARRASRAR